MHNESDDQISPWLVAVLPSSKKFENWKAQFERFKQIRIHFARTCFNSDLLTQNVEIDCEKFSIYKKSFFLFQKLIIFLGIWQIFKARIKNVFICFNNSFKLLATSFDWQFLVITSWQILLTCFQLFFFSCFSWLELKIGLNFFVIIDRHNLKLLTRFQWSPVDSITKWLINGWHIWLRCKG